MKFQEMNENRLSDKEVSLIKNRINKNSNLYGLMKNLEVVPGGVLITTSGYRERDFAVAYLFGIGMTITQGDAPNTILIVGG